MTFSSFYAAFKKYQKVFWLWLLLTLTVVAVLTFVQPLKYEATTELLILQNSGAATDPYAVSRTNQYLSSMFATVVNSQAFFNDTLSSGFNIEQAYFTTDTRTQMKTWEKTAEAQSIGDTGLIKISVYHTDRYQAEQIAQAINYTLKKKNSSYRGIGNDLTIKVLNEPIVSIWPVRPNILNNLVLALVIGCLAGLTHVYARATNVIVPAQPKVGTSQQPYQEPLRSQSFEQAPIMSQSVNQPVEPRVSLPEFETPRVQARPTVSLESVLMPAGGPVASQFAAPVQTAQPVSQGSVQEPRRVSDFDELLGNGDIKNVF